VTKTSGNPAFNKFTEHNWRVLDALLQVARQINKPPAQVALNWAATQTGITSTIIGATKLAQLDDNLAALDFEIPPAQCKHLDEASALETIQPYIFYGSNIQPMVTGGTSTRPWAPARATGGVTLPPGPAKASAAVEKQAARDSGAP
jgi:hypothetical protein